jgi:hypothetical protein
MRGHPRRRFRRNIRQTAPPTRRSPTSVAAARAASGHTAAAPPSSVMNSRRLMWDMGACSPVLCAGHQKAMALRGRLAARLAYHGGDVRSLGRPELF